jgi:hypothetical protein
MIVLEKVFREMNVRGVTLGHITIEYLAYTDDIAIFRYDKTFSKQTNKYGKKSRTNS